MALVVLTGVLSCQPSMGKGLATIQSLIDTAYHNNLPSVTVPSGTYTLSDPSGEGASGALLRFRNLDRKFTIDMTGVKLIVADRLDTAVLFEGCSNVTLQGATLQRAISPTSQGTVVNIDPDRKYIDIQIHTGYPTNYNDRFMERQTIPVVDFFAPKTRLLVVGSRDATCPSSVVSLGNDRLRITFPGPIPGPLAVGEYAAWRGYVTRDVDLIGCAHMTISHVTVRGGAGFAFHEINGDGANTYANDTITFPPKPTGATISPLLSMAADGLHSSCVKVGPEVKNCSFEGMNDDPINIHGVYAALGAVENAMTLDIALPWGSVPLRAGDTLDFVDENCAYAGSTKVALVQDVPNYNFTGSYPVGVPGFSPGHTFWKHVIIDTPAPSNAKCGWLIGNRNAQGNGFRIEHCTFRNTRGRVLIKADGAIDGCTLQNMGGSLQVEPEFNANESGYVTHLAITNNTIDRVGVFFGEWYAAIGALSISAIETRVPGTFVPFPGGFRNIEVKGNTFVRNVGVNIEITSARDVSITNNRFEYAMDTPIDSHNNYGVAPYALIWVTQSEGIHLAGNLIDYPRSSRNVVVKATDTAKVEGAAIGKGIKYVAQRGGLHQ